MKPHLLKFERCVFASLVIGAINAALMIAAILKTAGSFSGILAALAIFYLTVAIFGILLVLAISRKNYKFAKVTWCVVFVCGSIFYIPALKFVFEQPTLLKLLFEQSTVGVLTIATYLLQLLGTYFLIRGEFVEQPRKRVSSASVKISSTLTPSLPSEFAPLDSSLTRHIIAGRFRPALNLAPSVITVGTHDDRRDISVSKPVMEANRLLTEKVAVLETELAELKASLPLQVEVSVPAPPPNPAKAVLRAFRD